MLFMSFKTSHKKGPNEVLEPNPVNPVKSKFKNLSKNDTKEVQKCFQRNSNTINGMRDGRVRLH